MRGYEPLVVSAADVVMLAEGSETSFSGISVVIGAETSEVSISRLGITLASTVIPVGADWIDIELARQFQIHVFDETGEAWLDLEAVREWKHRLERNLRSSVDEREKVLSRLYGAVLDRIAQAIRQLMAQPKVQAAIGDKRQNVICSGGATRIAEFASVLTERFVDHDIANRIQSVRRVDDPELTVVRGLLISSELEARCRRQSRTAA
jgi:Tfp pilus assembly PilM family ATPase